VILYQRALLPGKNAQLGIICHPQEDKGIQAPRKITRKSDKRRQGILWSFPGTFEKKVV
jgi:hypothetical protein